MEGGRGPGQGPGGRTSEGPAGTAGKSADLASEATSKITSPATLQGLGRAHVGLLSPASKLGAEGHGYFWAGSGSETQPPVPPKSRCKGTAK